MQSLLIFYKNRLIILENSDNPIERLRNMIKAISEVGYNNYELAQITIATEMKDGGLHTNKLILPLLKEIFGNLNLLLMQ